MNDRVTYSKGDVMEMIARARRRSGLKYFDPMAEVRRRSGEAHPANPSPVSHSERMIREYGYDPGKGDRPGPTRFKGDRGMM